MILERQKSDVSGDVEKIKVNIRKKLTSLCRQKHKSKYKQDTVFFICYQSISKHTLSHPQMATENYANNGKSTLPPDKLDS